MSTARREILPHLSVMTHHCTNRDLTVAMAARYELDAEHVSFVTGSGESTNKVQSIVEDAQALREEQVVAASEVAFQGSADPATAGEDDSGDEGNDDAVDPEDDDPPEETGEDDEQAGLSDFV